MKMKEREQARILRKQGKSINEIVLETGLSKASVSVWIRDIVLTQEQKKRVTQKGRNFDSIEKRRQSRLQNEKVKKQKILDLAKGDYKALTNDDLKLVGIVLYMGEGGKTSKGMARIANSDPLIIKIMMRFFREICLVPNEKFRGHIHTFTHADISKTERYWSDVSGIPTAQFFKTYSKPSSGSLQKRETLPYGTFDIYVCDTRLFLTIMGWIEKIKEILVGDQH